jgi:sec-independent protein translocase protein TatA
MDLSSSLLLAGIIPGGSEWLWIFLAILLLFGGAKLPSFARGLGQSIREFKKASSTDDDSKEAPVADSKKSEVTKTPGSN